MRLFTTVFLLSAFSFHAQVSSYEWKWAIFHPFAALKVKKITRQCNLLTASCNVKLDGYSNGGRLDAYRHIFCMAAYAQKIAGRKLRKLGIAHEKGNRKMFMRLEKEEGELPDSMSMVMDLFNNEVGIAAGSANKSLRRDSLQQKVISLVNSGKAVIMKRDSKGNYIKCNGEKLPANLRDWKVPKCLVRSDFVYSD